MAKLVFWDKVSDVQAPEAFYTAEQYMQKYPWTRSGKVVVEVKRGVTVGLYSLGVLCENHGVPDDLDDNAALAYINEAIECQRTEYAEAARAAAETPSAEERIAAAMEFQNVLQMPVSDDATPVRAAALRSANSPARDPLIARIKRNCERGLWTAQMLAVAVSKNVITPEQYREITGEVYTA